MSVKERLEKQMNNAVAEVTAAKAVPEAPAPADDEALKAANERVKAGDYVVAYRTKNGALVTTRPHTKNDKPEVLR